MHDSQNSSLANRLRNAIAVFLLAFALALPGCGSAQTSDNQSTTANASSDSAVELIANGNDSTQDATNSTTAAAGNSAAATIADIPEYDGHLSIDINGGVPGFTAADAARGSFIDFSDLDFEGRSGRAFALIGPDTVTNAPRGDISDIHPSGWVQQKYDFVEGGVLYNRSHLIGHQLCGQDVAENLMTGTRTFNAQGMLHYEDIVADYVHDTGNHVLYRVTPLYAAYDLVARGVQMEAQSVEDGGAGVQFNVFVYNVEPGVAINYVTGENWESSDTPAVVSVTPEGKASSATKAGTGGSVATSSKGSTPNNASSGESSEASETYVLNTNSKKFHRPTCSAVDDISAKNKSGYSGSRDELIAEGYTPCKICNP